MTTYVELNAFFLHSQPLLLAQNPLKPLPRPPSAHLCPSQISREEAEAVFRLHHRSPSDLLPFEQYVDDLFAGGRAKNSPSPRVSSMPKPPPAWLNDPGDSREVRVVRPKRRAAP